MRGKRTGGGGDIGDVGVVAFGEALLAATAAAAGECKSTGNGGDCSIGGGSFSSKFNDVVSLLALCALLLVMIRLR